MGTTRIGRFVRQEGRDDFDAALDVMGGVEVPALADRALWAAQRPDWSDARLGAYVRGLVDGYLERWAERDAEFAAERATDGDRPARADFDPSWRTP